MEDFIIRRATRKNSRAFLKLLDGLAEFEHLDSPDFAGRRRIIEDVFRKKRANLLLAFAGRKPAGYAFYFYTYSTFLALPTFYLEDIFVDAEFRRKGLGLALFLKCVSEAYKNNCGRFEFAVLTWNKNAIKFYEKFGARKLKEWYSYRMTRNTIERLAKTKVQSRKQRFRPF